MRFNGRNGYGIVERERSVRCLMPPKSPAKKRRERQRLIGAVLLSVLLYFVLRWLFTL